MNYFRFLLCISFFVLNSFLFCYQATSYPEKLSFSIWKGREEIPCKNVQSLCFYVNKIFAGTREGIHVYKLGKWDTYSGFYFEDNGGKTSILPGVIPKLKNSSVNDMVEINGDIWVATDDGLVRFVYLTEQFENIYFPIKVPDNEPFIVQTLAYGENETHENLFVGIFPGSVYKLNVRSRELKKIADIDCQWITDMVVSRGFLFVSTQYKGVYAININSGNIEQVILGNKAVQENKVNQLSVDKDGNVYCACEAGPYMIPSEGFIGRNICSFFEVKNLLHVKSILGEFSKKIWIGTEKGLWVYENEVLKEVEGLEDIYITTLMKTETGLFVGTLNHGVFLIK